LGLGRCSSDCRPARLDAIAFREGISPEHAVRRVESGAWDGAILGDSLLAPGGVAARRAQTSDRLRYEVLSRRGVGELGNAGRPLFAFLSSRLGCDTETGNLNLAALCVAGS